MKIYNITDEFLTGELMKRSYRKYDDSVINMIIETRNPNLFPELKIPRTTALYWINHSKKKISLNDSQTPDYKRIVNQAKKELVNERTKRIFLEEVLKLHKKLTCIKELDFQISRIIKKFSKLLDIEALCKLSKLNIKKFYSFTNQTNFSRTHSHQLTIKYKKP